MCLWRETRITVRLTDDTRRCVCAASRCAERRRGAFAVRKRGCRRGWTCRPPPPAVLTGRASFGASHVTMRGVVGVCRECAPVQSRACPPPHTRHTAHDTTAPFVLRSPFLSFVHFHTFHFHLVHFQTFYSIWSLSHTSRPLSSVLCPPLPFPSTTLPTHADVTTIAHHFRHEPVFIHSHANTSTHSPAHTHTNTSTHTPIQTPHITARCNENTACLFARRRGTSHARRDDGHTVRTARHHAVLQRARVRDAHTLPAARDDDHRPLQHHAGAEPHVPDTRQVVQVHDVRRRREARLVLADRLERRAETHVGQHVEPTRAAHTERPVHAREHAALHQQQLVGRLHCGARQGR